MKLPPRLCMATGNAAAGDSDGSSNKLGSTASSSSSTVSTSSSAAAAAVSDSSSSTSLPSLSAAPSNAAGCLAASFTHLTTLLPLPTAVTAPSAAAAVAPAADSFHGFVVARPSSVALHDIFTLEATSASDSSDAASTATAGSVKCVAHVHGGKAVSGHQDGTLRLWRASTRTPSRIRLASALPTVADRLRRFPVPSNHVPIRRHHRRLWIEHADAVSGVAASADDRLLFSVSWDRTLKVWAVPSLRCLQSLPAHDDAVNAVAVAPDGTAYTGSADRRVRVWAPRPASDDKTKHKTKKPVYYLVATLSRHTAAVNAVAVACGGQMLYSAGNDRCVVVWEREDSASHMVAIGALRGHRKAVLSVVACAGDDGLVVSGSADQTVRAWRRDADGRGHACVAVIDGHASAVRSVAVALVPGQKRRQGGDGDEEWRVCSASYDGEVRVWSLRLTTGS
ncbi:hypothetical protein ACQ4PT_038200 [Festuca glaucescens]